MDARTLSEAMGGFLSLSRYAELLPHFEYAMEVAQVNTPLRAAMWCAQLGHESEGLKWMNELWGPTPAQLTYDGRMGNGPGEGYTYRGRGPIQLTGKDNYRSFTRWVNNSGISSANFVAEPDLVAEPRWGFLAAAWYWSAARPNLNKWSDQKNLLNASREINGWVTTPNGMIDRQARYNRCRKMGGRLLPGQGELVRENVLPYPRDQVIQDTFYNCGPASCQTVIRAASGRFLTEDELGRQLGTHTGGTDYIGSFPSVLNQHLSGAEYAFKDTPSYMSDSEKDTFWNNITSSIDAGFGVVVNIVAPPSNYPKAVPPSDTHPAYGGGTVYHYIAVMGHSNDRQRKVWVADSGFSPYGYWLSFEQLCSLIVPKGYAYSTAQPKEINMGIQFSEVHQDALHETKLSAKAAEKNATEARVEATLATDQLVGWHRDENGHRLNNGWPQLGNRTVVNALAVIGEKLKIEGFKNAD